MGDAIKSLLLLLRDLLHLLSAFYWNPDALTTKIGIRDHSTCQWDWNSISTYHEFMFVECTSTLLYTQHILFINVYKHDKVLVHMDNEMQLSLCLLRTVTVLPNLHVNVCFVPPFIRCHLPLQRSRDSCLSHNNRIICTSKQTIYNSYVVISNNHGCQIINNTNDELWPC